MQYSELLDRDRLSVEAIPAQFAEAWNRHDMGDTFSAFAADAQYVNAFGAIWRSRAEIIAEHVRLHQTVFANSVLRFLDIRSRFLGDEGAVIHARWELTGHANPAGQWVARRLGIMLFVLTKTPHGWSVVSLQNTDVVPQRHL